MSGSIFHEPRGSGRPRAAHEPYGAVGRAAWASSSQPTYGREEFPVSGFHPKKLVHKHQSSSAVVRSSQPVTKSRLSPAARERSPSTTNGESTRASMFGKSCTSGLAEPSGRIQRFEKKSAPPGTSPAK